MSRIALHHGQRADVSALLWAIQQHPELWNEHTGRTKSPDSPHREVDDIWLRYAADGITAQPHESVWYPSADALPVREIVYPLMAMLDGERLGGVLLTRIRAGRSCYPHVDHGWHASYYEKHAVQVQSAPGQYFCFEGERLEAKPGDIYTFDNSARHWVTNDTDQDRITLIVCIKREAVCHGE